MAPPPRPDPGNPRRRPPFTQASARTLGQARDDALSRDKIAALPERFEELRSIVGGQGTPPHIAKTLWWLYLGQTAVVILGIVALPFRIYFVSLAGIVLFIVLEVVRVRLRRRAGLPLRITRRRGQLLWWASATSVGAAGGAFIIVWVTFGVPLVAVLVASIVLARGLSRLRSERLLRD